jgi:hypothetical protein
MESLSFRAERDCALVTESTRDLLLRGDDDNNSCCRPEESGVVAPLLLLLLLLLLLVNVGVFCWFSPQLLLPEDDLRRRITNEEERGAVE